MRMYLFTTSKFTITDDVWCLRPVSRCSPAPPRRWPAARGAETSVYRGDC